MVTTNQHLNYTNKKENKNKKKKPNKKHKQ